jgi:cytochrome c6
MTFLKIMYFFLSFLNIILNKFIKIFFSFFFLLFFISIENKEIKETSIIQIQHPLPLKTNFEKGEKLFNLNCIACHDGGKNIILPEKSLKKEILAANGMNSLTSISYQVTNGKNGMPAFGGRLKEKEIEEIANYILESPWE